MTIRPDTAPHGARVSQATPAIDRDSLTSALITLASVPARIRAEKARTILPESLFTISTSRAFALLASAATGVGASRDSAADSAQGAIYAVTEACRDAIRAGYVARLANADLLYKDTSGPDEHRLAGFGYRYDDTAGRGIATDSESLSDDIRAWAIGSAEENLTPADQIARRHLGFTYARGLGVPERGAVVVRGRVNGRTSDRVIQTRRDTATLVAHDAIKRAQVRGVAVAERLESAELVGPALARRYRHLGTIGQAVVDARLSETVATDLALALDNLDLPDLIDEISAARRKMWRPAPAPIKRLGEPVSPGLFAPVCIVVGRPTSAPCTRRPSLVRPTAQRAHTISRVCETTWSQTIPAHDQA